jgi:hypothetical protein
MILQALHIIAAIGTLLTGLFSLIRPRAVQGFTGLSADSGRGITEIRAILGGVFVALGAAPLILNAPAAYQMLGITYLVVAGTRAVSMWVDKSVVRSNLISLATELVLGVVLVL